MGVWKKQQWPQEDQHIEAGVNQLSEAKPQALAPVQRASQPGQFEAPGPVTGTSPGPKWKYSDEDGVSSEDNTMDDEDSGDEEDPEDGADAALDGSVRNGSPDNKPL